MKIYRYVLPLAWLLAAAMVLAGCGGGISLPPIPPPVEPPPAEPPYDDSCQALLDSGMPFCHEAIPPMTCGDCVHNPSTDPRHCEKVADCPVEPPPVDPPPVDPPDGCAVEPQLVAGTCGGAIFNATVKQGTDALGDLTGGDPQENLKKLAAQIKLQTGRECIFGGIEALFLLRPDGKYEENHAVFFGNGGWTGNGFGKFIGCHDVEGAPPVEPPTEACPAPHPDLTHMKFKKDEKGNHLDTTWVTVNQEPFCREIGMSPDGNGTLRAGCPVRPEGNEERGPCEAELCDQKWECNGQPVDGWKGNPAQTNCVGHYKTWCSAAGSTAVLEGDR